MLPAFTKVSLAVALLAAMWGLSVMDRSERRAWVHPAGAAGPVRILRFYASAGTLAAGEKAQLCYSVENARSVRISPMIQEIYPSPNHCLEIVPEHTTHYTLLAEGYDVGPGYVDFLMREGHVFRPARDAAGYLW